MENKSEGIWITINGNHVLLKNNRENYKKILDSKIKNKGYEKTKEAEETVKKLEDIHSLDGFVGKVRGLTFPLYSGDLKSKDFNEGYTMMFNKIKNEDMKDWEKILNEEWRKAQEDSTRRSNIRFLSRSGYDENEKALDERYSGIVTAAIVLGNVKDYYRFGGRGAIVEFLNKNKQ